MEADRLKRLIDVGRSVLSELDLEAVLTRVLDVAQELTGARYAALGILDDAHHGLARFLTRGIDAETYERIGDLPRGRGVLGVLIDHPESLRLTDVSEHPRSYGFPTNHPPMHTFLGVPILVRGRAYGNLYLTEKAGGEFTEEDEAAVVVLADWAAIAIEHARLYVGEHERRRELERAVRRMEATAEIARTVGGETELPRVLELIVKRGRAFMEAKSMLVLLREDSDLVVAAASGEQSHEVLGSRIPIEGSVSGSVLRSGRPRRFGDVGGRRRFAHVDLIEAGTGLFVPLVFRRRTLGVIAVFDRLEREPEFDAEDERVMLAFAASAAMAVSTAQQVEVTTLRRSLEASERERQRWARELHDQTLQDLAALKVGLATARRSRDDGVIERAVDQAGEQIDLAIGELRALISDLRPAALDELGIEPALEALADRIRSSTELTVELETDLVYESGRARIRLHPELELAVYRVTQEALNNVTRHAHGHRVQIKITERDSVVKVTVADDGRGYELAQRTSGFGLSGMRERVTIFGGTLEIRSTVGRGTTIRATIPVR